MTETNGYRKFLGWQIELLLSRGLSQPDGRPLYQYRINDEEFEGLEKLLKEALSYGFGIKWTASITGFPLLFVLYGAEWWRRRYDGSGFSWDPILKDIGIDPQAWLQQARSECVRVGLLDWQLQLSQLGGLRYLGTVAVQGGLPLNLLANAHGKIGQLLKRVLHLAGASNVNQNDLAGWVESLQHHLPKTYRRPEICTLLAEMAWTTLSLKTEARLTTANEAIALLNQRIPDWRQRYPLPMDDSQAQGLLEQLIREASSVRAAPKQIFLPVERYLEQTDDGWHLRSRLTVSDELPFDLVARHFELPKQELPRTAELGLSVGAISQTLSLRQMAGREAYRCVRSSWGCDGSAVALEHLLTLTAPDGRSWSATAVQGGELDSGLPWIFLEQGTNYRFMRQGGGNISATEAIVYLPNDWTLPQLETNVDMLGEMSDPHSIIFHARGDIDTENHEGLCFKLRLGRADSQEDMLSLEGRRSWLAFSSPTQAFLGKPQISRYSRDGMRLGAVDGEWTAPSAVGTGFRYGPMQLRFPAKGTVRFRTRMVVLPENAQLIPEFRDNRSGALRFKNWQLATAQVTAPDVLQHCEQDDKDLLLFVETPSGKHLPVELQLELRWPHTSYPVRLAVAFPAQGVRAFNSEGEELANGSLLALQQLLGVRMRIALGRENLRCVLELETDNNLIHRNVRKHLLSASHGAMHLEIRLLDFMEDIQQLFSTDESTDARVLVTCKVSGAMPFMLKLARYGAQFILEETRVVMDQDALSKLTIDELAEIPVMAVRLEVPGEEAVRLQPLCSESIPTGSWEFLRAQQEPGSWLIYPRADSKLPFRPTLFPVAGNIELNSELARAFAMPSRADRIVSLDNVLAAMADDFNHPDWQSVDQYIAQIGHLPLPTLDLWKRFVYSPAAMTAIALRFSKLPDGFLERFANELIFTWELIPLRTWEAGIGKLQTQCSSNYADAAKFIFEHHLANRIDDLCATNGALAFTLGLASYSFIEKFRKDSMAIRNIGSQLFSLIFQGEDCEYMKLRQIHADDNWPADLSDFVTSLEHDVPFRDFIYNNLNAEQFSLVNVPIFLALQIATDSSQGWFSDRDAIHQLRKYRAFDRQWFVAAFNHTIARAAAEDLLTKGDLNT